MRAYIAKETETQYTIGFIDDNDFEVDGIEIITDKHVFTKEQIDFYISPINNMIDHCTQKA